MDVLISLLPVLNTAGTFLFPPSSVDVSRVKFIFYNNAKQAFVSNSPQDDLTKTCNKNQTVTVILHGAMESCSQNWVQQLIKSPPLSGDCVVCMDYSDYSYHIFPKLYSYFNSMSELLANKCKKFSAQGFDLANFHIVSFSFGAVTSLKAGQMLGSQRIGSIDAIDPVHPKYDTDKQFPQNPRECALHTQCIHCSESFGSNRHNTCHEDWVMGYSGTSQMASGLPPYGPHGLCPIFYAFAAQGNQYTSVDLEKSQSCNDDGITQLLGSVKSDVSSYMGYKDRRASPNGVLLANTYKCSPFNQDGQSCGSSLPQFV